MSGETRERILEATYACVARSGLARTTMDDAAREAGLSRATIYRYFPGGRDELIGETVSWEVARFFSDLARAVADAPDFATLLEGGLVFAHRSLEEHEVLHKVLETEPDVLLPTLTTTASSILRVIAAFLAPYLPADRLRPGLQPDDAAEVLARLILSFIANQGRWDLTDPVAVRELVRGYLLAGVFADRADPGARVTDGTPPGIVDH